MVSGVLWRSSVEKRSDGARVRAGVGNCRDMAGTRAEPPEQSRREGSEGRVSAGAVLFLSLFLFTSPQIHSLGYHTMSVDQEEGNSAWH